MMRHRKDDEIDEGRSIRRECVRERPSELILKIDHREEKRMMR